MFWRSHQAPCFCIESHAPARPACAHNVTTRLDIEIMRCDTGDRVNDVPSNGQGHWTKRKHWLSIEKHSAAATKIILSSGQFSPPSFLSEGQAGGREDRERQEELGRTIPPTPPSNRTPKEG